MKQETPYIIIDVDNMCYRSWYALAQTSYTSRILYGVLKQLILLSQMFFSTRFVFCFDGGESIRKRLFPAYKANHVDTPERVAIRRGISDLYDSLANIGYNNLFRVEGYEADDLIGFLVKGRKLTDQMIIVSNDNDLLQLLDIRKNVTIWNPSSKRIITGHTFTKQHGVSPNQWSDVKALMGCESDNIPGVHGAGPVIAVKFIKGLLAENSKSFKSIMAGKKQIEINKRLVRLPYPALADPKMILEENEPKMELWNKEVVDGGIEILSNQMPC